MTCTSPYREEIDKLMVAGWNNREIERFLKGKYPGNKIPTYESLRSHKANHVEAIIEKAVNSNQFLQKKVRNEIKGTIQTAEQLRSNLSIISISLKDLWDGFQDNRDPSKYRTLTGLIAAANKTIDLLLKYQEEISKTSVSEEEIHDKLFYAISGLDEESFNRVYERWNSYGTG